MNRKGKPQAAYPESYATTFTGSRQLFAVVGGLFLSPENLITQTDKGDNEEQQLEQVRICNIHWHRPPFFRLEGSPLRKNQRVSRPALVSLHTYYHKSKQRTISISVSRQPSSLTDQAGVSYS